MKHSTKPQELPDFSKLNMLHTCLINTVCTGWVAWLCLDNKWNLVNRWAWNVWWSECVVDRMSDRNAIWGWYNSDVLEWSENLNGGCVLRRAWIYMQCSRLCWNATENAKMWGLDVVVRDGGYSESWALILWDCMETPASLSSCVRCRLFVQANTIQAVQWSQRAPFKQIQQA